ncbi:MAG: ABC transporter permease [Clostridiales bacterium]|nr:ABC transporter permease [Clostridiales bacterium]MDD7431933.1 ABC transporter permease [Clostridiales bacterium]MDY3061210.1 ABC transporter permease [Eubacteriales bacterium]
MDLLSSMVILAFIYATPILVAATGALYSERSGVTNIAIEGIMTIGGFAAATITTLTEARLGIWAPWLGILIGAVLGLIYSALHAYVSIDLQGDQTISGTALNMLSLGISVYFCQIIFHQQRTRAFQRGFVKMDIPVLSDIPILGNLFFKRIYITFYLALLIVLLTYIILWKTPYGLRLRAAGEHPSAVDSLGISVRALRYSGVLISGFLGGLAGGIMVLTQATQFSAGSIHGVGFIAMAALIFGRWNPWGILGSSIFFGFSQIFSIFSRDIPLLENVPGEFFYALPYALTVLAMVAFSRKSAAPKAVGVPYSSTH